MISIEPTDIGFGIIDFLSIIALLSIYYLRWKGVYNVPYVAYFFLSSWVSLLQLPFAVAWSRSWPFIGNLLILAFFYGCKFIQAIILFRVIKPAMITAFATNSGSEFTNNSSKEGSMDP